MVLSGDTPGSFKPSYGATGSWRLIPVVLCTIHRLESIGCVEKVHRRSILHFVLPWLLSSLLVALLMGSIASTSDRALLMRRVGGRRALKGQELLVGPDHEKIPDVIHVGPIVVHFFQQG